MTIIEPNKTNRGVKLLFAGSIAALMGAAFWSIILYNKTVNMEHDIVTKNREYQALLAKNGELKQTLYSMTDVKNLQRAARDGGLTLIAHPEYVEPGSRVALAAAD